MRCSGAAKGADTTLNALKGMYVAPAAPATVVTKNFSDDDVRDQRAGCERHAVPYARDTDT